jgi:hypothetical protein
VVVRLLSMFSVEDRERLRSNLISNAHADRRVTGAAILGSAAVGTEDAWSDIDLALAFSPEANRAEVIADWTERMYGECGAVHPLDVSGGPALYRVFLLANMLQVDLSFWPESQFTAAGPTFRLLFGTVANTRPSSPPDVEELIGLGWLYVLHARSSIARGRVWQAEYMISAARDQVLALACVRQGLPAREGRGIDELPPGVTDVIGRALIGSLDRETLTEALRTTTDALLSETEEVDPSSLNG